MPTDEQLRDRLEAMAGRKCLPEGELHVCWLIEQGLSEQEQNHYTTRLIFDRIGPDNTNLVVWEALTASWQQRAEALLKVKGIAI